MLNFYLNPKDAHVRVHGNGFVQAELADGNKIHIWASDCPRQKEPTFIHNHTSGFRSTILWGMLRNEEYSLHKYYEGTPEDATIYNKYEAVTRNKKDTVLEAIGEKCFIQARRRFYFAEGTTYEFPGIPTLFHASYPETYFTVTRVVRLEPEPPHSPIILIEEGKQPDNSFDRYEHEDYALECYLQVKHMLRLK